MWVPVGTFTFAGTDLEYVSMLKNNDSSSASADAVWFLKVSVNNPPTAVADSITVNEGGTVTTLNSGGTSVLANDTDADGEALTASLIIDVLHGVLTFNADGTVLAPGHA